MSSRDIANLKNGLVAAWIPSLGSTGYRLVDRVGSNHGVLTGMDAGTAWTVSNGNLALDFDGVNDKVALSMTNTANLTASCWVYSRNINNANGEYFISKWQNGGSLFFDFYIGAFQNNWIARSGDGSSNASSLLQTPATANQWTHLLFSRNATDLRLYVNGSEKTSSTAVGFQGGGTASFELSALNTLFANCQLDDIRIYSRALSATEISLLSKERGIGFKTNSRTSSAFAKRYAYKPPKDKTYAAITRSQSDYDSLREGLVLAICPSVSGATGYRAVDVSGRGNHGSLVNMDAASDWVASNGMALDFDGTDAQESSPGNQNRIQINKNFVTTSFGVSGWIYWQSANKRGICANGPSSAAPSFAVTILTDGSLETYRGTNTSSTAKIQLNQWNHFYIFNDGTTTFYYINGSFSNSSAQSVGGASQTEFYIGYNYWGAVNALLDDFRAYTRPLTPPEIRQLASRRGIGLQSTPRHTDYLETREKTYSVIVKSQQEHSSLSEGLVGAWCPSVSGATGYTIPDASSRGNALTLNVNANTKFIPGKNGISVDLNGGRAEAAYTTNITGTSNFTLSIWIKLSSTQSASDQLIPIFGQKAVNAADAGIMMYYWYGGANAGKFMHSTANGSSRSEINIATAVSITSQWAHVVMVRNSALANGGTYYINGIEYPLASAITIWDVTTTSKLRIAQDASASRTGNFTWDDARVYNRALTEPEIKRLASNPNVGLRSQKQTMFYQFPSGSKRRRILTGMT